MGDVLRSGLALVPVAVASAVVGVGLGDRPLLAVVIAAAAAAVGAAAVGRGRATAGDSRAAVEGEAARLAEERARAERLLEQLPLAVLLFTGRGLAYANPAARQLFGLADGAGRSPLDVLTEPALADAVEEAGETGRTVETEVTRGDRVLSARSAETVAGEVALVVTDLTEARRVEEMRRDFVVNASHELKTPAAGMRALADSIELAVDRDPPRARSMIARLRQEAERLSVMVRDLLDLARLEEVAAPRAPTSVDVAAAARRQVDRFRALAADRSVEVFCACPEPATVVALPEDVRLIIDNLVENAVRYNREGGRVDVDVRRHDSEVVVEVRDTGIGIPSAERDRVFERFYRVDKARTRAAGGTGLGLSLVRNAVERQGGQVTVDSTPGEGSTFRVILPVEGAVRDGA